MIKTESLRKAFVVSSSLNLLNKIFSYLKILVLVAVAGMGDMLDSYFIALSVVAIYIVIFGDVFDSLGVPELSRAWENKRYDEFNKITGHLFILAILLTIILNFLLFFTYQYFLIFQAYGFSKEKKEIVVKMLVYLIPFTVCYLPYHAIGAFFRSQKYLSFFYFTQLIGSIVTLTYILLFNQRLQDIPISASIGLIAGFIVMLSLGIKRYVLVCKFEFSYVSVLFKNFIPLLLILGTLQLYNVVDRSFASQLNSGAISAMYYPMVLVSAFTAIIGVKDIIVSDLSTTQCIVKLVDNLVYFAIYIAIPISVFIKINVEPIVNILLDFGKLTDQNKMDTVVALSMYIIILLPAMVSPIFYRLLQVYNKMHVIFITSLAGVALNALMNYTFMHVFNMGMSGLLLATNINYISFSLIMVFYTYQKLDLYLNIKGYIARFFVLGTICIISVLVINVLFSDSNIWILSIKLIIFLLLYSLALFLLPYKELDYFKNKIKSIMKLKTI
ncbi:lipid II flippase MurJ [Seleniivibrio woodruffii]|uniref:lipid II flippase MurJ n=1 Tax=Seleniivibrio woodruffii TaxID=1078050 RepID=UPI00240A66F2|nr:lipid II flippase MurJ [Seleniivibrio woodruffii]